MNDPIYQSYMGKGPKQIVHWEHWSNPDAETYLTGIDHYAHPRQCRLKLRELYPELRLGIPESDDPKPRPEEQTDQGKGRWGDTLRDHWQQQEAVQRFESQEAMLRFSPLEHADFRGWQVMESADYSSEDVIYQRYRRQYPSAWGDQAPAGSTAFAFFYNSADRRLASITC